MSPTYPRITRESGYILVETVVALVLLSVGAYAIHRTLQQSIATRGQAQDYTQVRFLMEKLIAEVEIQPLLQEETRKGQFEGRFDRFAWEYTVRKVELPKPVAPAMPRTDGREREPFKFPVEYLAHVRGTISWQRRGQPYSESFETLFNPNKLWLPPEEDL